MLTAITSKSSGECVWLSRKPHIGIFFADPESRQENPHLSHGTRWENPCVYDQTASGELFPGQYFDAETNLHYNWNRYYDSELGRYITSDPIGLVGGLGTYRYADTNPRRFIDPLGEATTVAVGVGGGLLLGGADYYSRTPAERQQLEAGLSIVLGSISGDDGDDDPLELPPGTQKPRKLDELKCDVQQIEPIRPVPPNPGDVCEIIFAKRMKNCQASPGRSYSACVSWAYARYLICSMLKAFDPPRDL